MNEKKSLSRSGKQLRVGVLFGGMSAEHEVSLVSAASIMCALDKARYKIIPIGIAPDGRWFSDEKILTDLQNRHHRNDQSQCFLPANPTVGGLVSWNKAARKLIKTRLDVIFPVIHGTFGEDGIIQGLLELANIPYVGAGVLGSSAGMDKIISKQLCWLSGVPITSYVWFYTHEYRKKSRGIRLLIENKIKYPLFVKPANLGSSVGISKVHKRSELHPAILVAGRYDKKILVEESIENAREIEISVLGNDFPRVSVPGEIIPSNEFYDYEAKYVDGLSKTIIPAKLTESVKTKVQRYAVDAFRAVDCAGMARIDFLVVRKTGKIYFNEINTIPGFTSISMYPKLWEASGLSYPRLLDKLIRSAIQRHREKGRLKRTFMPKVEWYKK